MNADSVSDVLPIFNNEQNVAGATIKVDARVIPEVTVSNSATNLSDSIENILGSSPEFHGHNISYATHNLHDIIKQERADSSASSWTHEGASASRSHSSSSISSSNSGWSNAPPCSIRSPLSPEEIPPLDPSILSELEARAQKLSSNVESINQNIVSHLKKMSDCSTQCLSVYKESVDSTCDSVDSAIKSMYALMAKCEELGRAVLPVYTLQDQIKEIKRLLDVFEKQLSDDEC